MPIYEYECEHCRNRFEVIQKFSDRPLKKCERCGGSVHRVLSAPALVFKGSGWYVTDYANPDRKKAEKAEKDGSGNGRKKADAATPQASTPSNKSDD